MKRGIIAVLAALGILLTAVTMGAAPPASAAGQETCPKDAPWVKVDGLSGTSFTYTPPAGYTVADNCYKASTAVHYGSGQTVTSTVTNHNGKVQNLSHASFKLVEIEDPDACEDLDGIQPEGTRCEAPPTETRDKISERCEWGKRVIHHFETTYSWNGSEWVGTEKWVGKDDEPLTAEECGHTPETHDKTTYRCAGGVKVVHHYVRNWIFVNKAWVLGPKEWVGKDKIALTSDEKEEHGCAKPEQPEPSETTETRESCEEGVEVRTTRHTYAWDHELWDYVEQTAVGEWTFDQELSDEAYDRENCQPDQPDPTVETTEWVEGSPECGDSTVTTTRTKTTTTYAWDSETRSYVVKAAIAEVENEVRDLTNEEYTISCQPEQPEPTVRVTDHVEVDCELGGVRSWTTTYSTPADVWDAEARQWVAGVEGPGVDSEPVLTAYTNGECDEASPEDDDPKSTDGSNGGDTKPIANAAPKAASTPGTLPNTGGPAILAGLLAMMLLAGGGAILLLRRRMQ